MKEITMTNPENKTLGGNNWNACTIAASLKHLGKNSGKSLILTHTHAGVASLKAKIHEMGVSGSQCNIETISSFCQKYIKAFCRGDDTPDISNPGYYDFIVDNACEILKVPAVGQVIQASYERMFVDKYQDCSAKQHKLIMVLSSWLQHEN